MCAALEARSGWIVCGHAVDGMDALEKAVDLKPDVILVDVSMRGLNGFEALEVKMRCASEWVGWGQLSDDGSGHYNLNRSEGPWGRT